MSMPPNHILQGIQWAYQHKQMEQNYNQYKKIKKQNQKQDQNQKQN